MGPIRVVGLGSPYGDDSVGWRAAGALSAAALPPAVEVRRCAAPASELLPALRGAARVLLLDGVVGAGAIGEVVRLAPADLQDGISTLSSHGVDVATLLELARSLGDLPARVELWGVEIEPHCLRTPGAPLSAPVAAAVPRLVAAVLASLAPSGAS